MLDSNVSLELLEAEKAQRELAKLNEQDDAEIRWNQGVDNVLEMLEAEKLRRSQPEQPREDTTLVDVVADLAGGVNELALEGADLLTAPSRLAGKIITGKNVRTPSQVVSEYGIGGDVRYVDDESVSDLLNYAGYSAAFALSLKPVARSSDLKSFAEEMAGFGATALTTEQLALARTAKIISDADDKALGLDPKLWDDDTIFDEAQSILDKGNITFNRNIFTEYEAQLKEIMEFEKKYADRKAKGKSTEKLVEPKPVPEPTYVGGIGTVVDLLVAKGLDRGRVLDVINKRGGLRFATLDEMIELDKKFMKADGSGAKPVGLKGWYDRNFLPVADMIRGRVDRAVGNTWERAIESNMRYADQLTQKHKPLLEVAELANKSPELKGILLDIPMGFAKVSDAERVIAKLGGDVAAFRRFLADSESLNLRARTKVFKDEVADDNVYFHTERRTNSESDGLGMVGKKVVEEPAALKNRNRPPSKEMTPDELRSYQNPLLSQMQYMSDMDQLIRITDEMNMRPSMGKKDNLNAFFNEFEANLLRNNFGKERSNLGRKMVQMAYDGHKDAPPPAVQAFMSLGYAGTLAQLKTATLNLHDIAVVAVTQGANNTARGMASTMMKEFGKTAEQMGLSSQAIGEYVRGAEEALRDPTVMNKIADLSRKFTEGAMTVSMFRSLDLYGKGVVLRAAVEKMRSSAQAGKLAESFGDLATRDQLREIRPYLQKGIPVKDMPQSAAAIVEELAFVALGKQQLISYAGRPLGYLKNPLLRPAYAMTGFAVKQQALMRDMIGQALKKKDYTLAGQIAARYIAYAGVGYAGLDVFRESVFKGEPQTEEDFMLAMTDQIMGAMFMNKLDTRSLGMAKNDPVEYLMESFLPPSGIIGAAGKDSVQLVEYLLGNEEEPPSELLKRSPLLGDYFRYHHKED